MHKITECFIKGLKRLLDVSKPVTLSVHEQAAHLVRVLECSLGLPSEELICRLLESGVLRGWPLGRVHCLSGFWYCSFESRMN